MQQTKQKNRVIFISHSSEDTWLAKQLAREISSCGAKPFLDDADIKPGEDFNKEIHSSLKEAHELIVLLTPWALEQLSYILLEVGAAWLRDIPIVGVLYGLKIEDVLLLNKIPAFLKSRNLIYLNNFESYLHQLKSRIFC